jgi:hypothetical protein
MSTALLGARAGDRVLTLRSADALVVTCDG